jgi:hypothetical protein
MDTADNPKRFFPRLGGNWQLGFSFNFQYRKIWQNLKEKKKKKQN